MLTLRNRVEARWMVSPLELRRIAAFSSLPDDQIRWFLSHAQEISVQAGETFVRQGEPADWMFIFLDGLFQWRGEFGGDTVSLPAQAGDVSGVFPFSRMKRFSVTGRALTDGRLLKFPAALFPELIQKMPELTATLVAMMSDRIREGTRIEQQRDRLVSLGKLSAGLAHELNNPASAAKRATGQMRDALVRMRNANAALWRLPLDDSEKSRIEEAEATLLRSDMAPLEALALSDLEEGLDSILRRHGQDNSGDLSAALARCNMPPAVLESLLIELGSATARDAIQRIAATAELAWHLNTIASCTSRISSLVQTVKEYTYMDQAPVQNVDVVRSLENTLGILAHKLKPKINVKRDYQAIPLLVNTVGTELSQVWTNIIENAIDAMPGQGELRVRTFREDHFVVVEINDNGPGIPPEIRPHIFDPFFTTKGVGEGTGLGLNTVQTIVRKHGGNVQVDSKPGDTRFQVWLPFAASPEAGTT
jgi:signal transduction histidine kinase